MKVYIYRPDQAGRQVKEVPPPSSYQEIAAIVEPFLGGHYLDHTRVLFDPDGNHIEHGQLTDMFVAECGQLIKLPINHDATEIYKALRKKTHWDSSRRDDRKIFGVAVVFEKRVWF